jgi:hypothetical protein
MKPRTIAMVMAGGVAAALAGRALLRPTAAPTHSQAPESHPPHSDVSRGDVEGAAVAAVFDDGQPVVGAWVVFHDEAGTVTAAIRTGKDGTASSPVGSGAMVTVAYGTSIKQLFTVTGVEPNDRLVFGEEEDEGAPEEAACTARVSLPGPHPKASRHVLALDVGTTEVRDPRAPIATSVLERYIVDGRFSVMAEALGRDDEPIAFAHLSAPGCPEDGGPADVILPSWSEDYRTFTLDITAAGDDELTVFGELFMLGQETDRLGRGRRAAPLRGRTKLAFVAPRPLGTHAAYEVVVARPGTAERSVILERRQAMPERVDIDLRERLLPRVTDVRVDDSDTARPTVRWRPSDGAASADALVVRLTWPDTGEHHWTIAAPPDRPPRLAMPALPDELASWRPDGRALTASVALVEASFVDGFDDLKRRGLETLEDPPKTAAATVLRYSAVGGLSF